MRVGRLAGFVDPDAWAAVGSAAAQALVSGLPGEPVQRDPAVITDGISARITRPICDGW
jgi:hypothetical protein